MRLPGAWKRHAFPLTLLAATAKATITSPPERRQEPSITAISDCRMQQTDQYCMVGATGYRVLAPGTPTSELASSYTDCHAHVAETWCMNPNGGEVQITLATPPPSITAVTDCHLSESQVYCSSDATEFRVSATVTASSDVPPAYTSCHSHGTDTYCLEPSGDDVQIVNESEEAEADTGSDEPTEENCHFHAGVEHCVGGSGGARSCERTDREYNVPLRIGLLFAILVTSSIGVFAPILLAKFLSARANTVLLIIKQFGTGVIMSTALVHLFTHAELMFGNECLEGVMYEATTAAILMAGLFMSFFVEYLGYRFVKSRAKKAAAAQSMQGAVMSVQSIRSLELVSVYIMEAGIIFHSLLIGLTLMVAGDSFLLTLFVVIIFHQMFEGLALGTRIAALGSGSNSSFTLGHNHTHPSPIPATKATSENSTTATTHPEDSTTTSHTEFSDAAPPLFHVSTAKKISLAAAFALVTPVGMAIGIGVLDVFNGNDPQTIVAIGVLDAFSAGILLWVGVVEMWAADWVFGGGLTDAGVVVTGLGMGGLVAGMVVMSVLGKWA
ncbi:hypothetical protein F5144DRAFT_167333 [Chaetomium tenue]|uniref:Uncharacterized protein n=1 Tax=Chaetomium tenue TaxID=1854479 RepID=A0ACB7PDS2_9PEZI|nr:hypothetical protein F5144DRAFT_167333 [Chaetomium globosum]